MLMRTPDTLTGKRDRALLALGFAGAFRRSELVALDVSDLREDPEGLRVLVRRSKVDQEGAGLEKAIPAAASFGRCPAAGLARCGGDHRGAGVSAGGPDPTGASSRQLGEPSSPYHPSRR